MSKISGGSSLVFNYLPVLLGIVLYILIFIVRLEQGGWDLKLDLFSGVRQSLDQQISQLLPSPEAELLSGILLGQNKNLPGRLKLALRDTSTLHIVVASGQNLSMVAGFFLAFSGLIKRRNALILSLLAALGYTILSGMQVPIIRAAIMFSLASLAQISGRQRDGAWVLIVTVGLMLLINPSWISSLSFQLSVLATFGVVLVAPILLKFLKALPLIGQDLAVVLGAQLMVVPVIIQNFHQLSLTGVLANLLIGWTIPLVMILGTVMLILSWIWIPLAQVVSLAAGALLIYFIYIVQFFASLPFAWEYIGEQVWLVWTGYYLVLAGIMLLLRNAQTTNFRRP
ncbi:MAG: ComEC/Rec2 family competence protein [Candidatus Daviesbacteria bacterium]|nr:ComEC/Rec2 family competence protein [Candidatus Daviesbacteria bacterium]